MKTGKHDVGPVHFLEEVVSGGDQSRGYNGASQEVGCFNDSVMSYSFPWGGGEETGWEGNNPSYLQVRSKCHLLLIVGQ